MARGKVLDHCPMCKRKRTPEEHAAVVKAKKDNALASRAKALANGNTVGRQRSVDYARIRK